MIKMIFTFLLITAALLVAVHLFTRDKDGCGVEPVEACQLIQKIEDNK